MGQRCAEVSDPTIPVIEAIRSKRLIAFDYNGVRRVVEPHTYGLDKWQRKVLCAYQIETSGGSDGWRTFVMAKASQLRLDPRRFEQPRPGYQHNDGAFTQILAQL